MAFCLGLDFALGFVSGFALGIWQWCAQDSCLRGWAARAHQAQAADLGRLRGSRCKQGGVSLLRKCARCIRPARL